MGNIGVVDENTIIGTPDKLDVGGGVIRIHDRDRFFRIQGFLGILLSRLCVSGAHGSYSGLAAAARLLDRDQGFFWVRWNK